MTTRTMSAPFPPINLAAADATSGWIAAMAHIEMDPWSELHDLVEADAGDANRTICHSRDPRQQSHVTLLAQRAAKVRNH